MIDSRHILCTSQCWQYFMTVLCGEVAGAWENLSEKIGTGQKTGGGMDFVANVSKSFPDEVRT